jgi:DNA-binding SARP family transcriptional activator
MEAAANAGAPGVPGAQAVQGVQGTPGSREVSATAVVPAAQSLLQGNLPAAPAEPSFARKPSACAPAVSTPLYLCLFGKLEARLANQPLNNSFLSRTKVRRLLAFLAFNQLHVVSRDSLIAYLWPYLDVCRAQKNLYTSWCMLAKGLGSERVRDCPYIRRNGELYQLNPELVVCDTRQFEALAHAVLFSYTDIEAQIEAVLALEELYCDSLVADIPTDTFISGRMTAYRSLMVDAHLLVTRQLREAGEYEKALYHARAAYELDVSREDVYRELMDTQFVAGQRTSAMQTYFSCKRYLSDELGILPSRSTTALYQDLLLDSSR